MRNPGKIAAALILAAMPLAANAQNTPSATERAAEAGNAPQLTPEQMENLQRGIRIMRAFTAAFTSEQVSEAVKGRLITCLYGNNLAEISAATGRVFASSPNLDAASPTDLYRAAAGVCGVVFRQVPPAGEEDAPAPVRGSSAPADGPGR